MGVPKPEYEAIIIRPEDIEPSSQDMKVISVCNPGGIMFKEGLGEKFYLLLRVMEQTNSNFRGHVASPRAIKNEKKEYEVRWEWEREGRDAHHNDPKSFLTIEPEEKVRPTYISHFRLAESTDGVNFTISKKPTFFPIEKYEEYGIEDARITQLHEPIYSKGKSYSFLISYVACSESHGVCSAFALTSDFKNFVRFPEENPNIIFFSTSKDVVVFPKKFVNPRTNREEFVAMTRPSSTSGYMIPSIFLSYSNDLIQWGDHQPFIRGDEKGHVGAGPAPIELDEGWLIIDHQHRHIAKNIKEYVGRAYIVDKQNPLKILKRSDEIIEPHLKVEGKSFVSNVTFPSAAMIKDSKIFIYTGEEDMAVGIHIYDMKEFMRFLSPVN
jgi:beta-1,2-mannobiose phosphorylase / 1,2-beta-oligomannan phosphorylase